MKKNPFIFLMFSLVLLSCNATSYSSVSSSKYEPESYGDVNSSSSDRYDGVIKNLDDLDSDLGYINKRQNVVRKIIYNSSLTLSIENPDSVNASIKKITLDNGGYLNEVGSLKTIIRVPNDKLDLTMVELSKLGEVLYKSMKGQDVSSDYEDHAIRLDNAQKSRDRYLEILKKAITVDEILKVERELERLNETIEFLKGKMNKIDHLSEFSTITIALKEKKKLGIIGYVGVGIYRSIRWLFIRN